MLMMPVLVWGTTLRLSPEVDLLVLDGKKVSSSLLKGAESIELDNGPHQLVIRVEKNLNVTQRDRRPGFSPPLVVSFDSKEIDLVNIILPRKDDIHAQTPPYIKLLDGHAKPIPIRTDVLETIPDPTGTDYEEETLRYNKAGKKASMPGFATLTAVDAHDVAAAKPAFPPSQSETLTEQRLKYLFSQADKSTRARFLRWAKETPTP
jgi:hypothetical protein